MRRRKPSWSYALGFVCGSALTAALIWSYQHAPARLQARLMDDCGPLPAETETEAAAGGGKDEPVRAARSTSVLPVIGVDSLANLKSRALSLPVSGISTRDLQESFNDARGEGRRHEAIDILAPRNTPIIAVEDGTVAKLFTSKAGGLTVYQFDPASSYAYYYAHLERYAPGLRDGDRIRRGQVIGYVGTSGNAPPETPHLHFAIFKLTDKKQWWQGTPIDPFAVFRASAPAPR